MRGITKRQKQVLLCIKKFIRDHGFPPSRVEISELMGFSSPNAAQDHLALLEKKKYISTTPGVARGIRIIRNEEL